LIFSEPLDVTSVPASAAVAELKSGGIALTIPGVIQSATLHSSYVGNSNGSGGSSAGTISRPDSKTVRITLGTVTQTEGGVTTGTAAVTMSPVAAITDQSGNTTITSWSASVTRLF
jgi:hypothetical protein